MRLSDEEMMALLRENAELLQNDPDAVSLEFEVDDDGEVMGLVLTHLFPNAKAAPSAITLAVGDLAVSVPLHVVKGELPVEESAPPDIEAMHEEAQLAGNFGMSGTKIEEGGYWGTLCLSGQTIAIEHEQGACSQDNGFLLSNSHVLHHVGGLVHSRRTKLGDVTFVYDLDLPGENTFDAGIASTTENVPAENAFRVYRSNGEALQIAGLKQVSTNMAVAKMGARTGWTEGRVLTPIITRVDGHTSLYPSWKGTYRSRGGDSGSPILHEAEDGKWYLVGIHFASGPCFHSWDNAMITAS